MKPRTTPRLLLRELCLDDVPALHREVYDDPEVVRYYSSYGTQTLAEVTDRVAGSLAAWQREPFGRYAVERRSDHAFLGQVHLSPYLCLDSWPGHDAGGLASCEVEVSFAFGRDHWGHGYAAEAVGAMVAMAFGELRLRRLVSYCHRRNTRSIALHRRVGYDLFDPNGNKVSDDYIAVMGNPDLKRADR